MPEYTGSRNMIWPSSSSRNQDSAIQNTCTYLQLPAQVQWGLENLAQPVSSSYNIKMLETTQPLPVTMTCSLALILRVSVTVLLNQTPSFALVN